MRGFPKRSLSGGQKEFGHLFSGRYKALLVDGSGCGYLKTACDYVHLNPARAHLLKPEQPLREYLWSSYLHYLMGAPSHVACLLQRYKKSGTNNENSEILCSDPATVKLELAARLRRGTTLSIKAIAARVGLGSSKAVNRSLHDCMRGPAQGGAEVGTGQEQLNI